MSTPSKESNENVKFDRLRESRDCFYGYYLPGRLKQEPVTKQEVT